MFSISFAFVGNVDFKWSFNIYFLFTCIESNVFAIAYIRNKQLVTQWNNSFMSVFCFLVSFENCLPNGHTQMQDAVDSVNDENHGFDSHETASLIPTD